MVDEKIMEVIFSLPPYKLSLHHMRQNAQEVKPYKCAFLFQKTKAQSISENIQLIYSCF